MSRDDQYPRDDEDLEEYQDRLRDEHEPDYPTNELTDKQIAEIGAMHEPNNQAF